MKSAGVYWKFFFGALPFVVLFGIATNFTIGQYAVSPAAAINVAAATSVSGYGPFVARGRILSSDPTLTRLTPIQFLEDRYLKHRTVLPSKLALSGQTQVSLTQLLEASVARTDALMAVLNLLGRSVPIQYGAEVTEVGRGTPASKVLSVGDLIYALDGVQTPSPLALSGLLRDETPGQSATLSILRPSTLSSGGLKAIAITLTLGTDPANAAAGYLGVKYVQSAFYDIPVTASVPVTNIGGADAGLAMALSMFEQMQRVDLTNGRYIVALGRIAPSGAVSSVAGVAAAAIAATQEHISLLMVPTVDLKVAEKYAGKGVKVVAVKTLSDAVSLLKRTAGI